MTFTHVRSLAAASLVLFACRAPSIPRPAPLPTVTPSEASRFRLEGPEHEKAPSPLDLVGVAVPMRRPDDDARGETPGGPPTGAPASPAPSAAGDDLGSEPGEGGFQPPMTVEDVLLSVEQHFPLILAAIEQVEIAEGKLLAAQGGFDLKLGTKGEAALQGFYESERLNVTLEQPTALWGASVLGGYRIGRGDFAEYDEKAKTLTDGELRAGVNVPLLQGGRIDERRLAVWQARLARDQADPRVIQKRLEASRKAASAYWKWVAAGQKYELALRLLSLAQDRDQAVRRAVEEGELAPIARIENRRLIVEREAILVGAERKLQETSIELSLYYRSAEGIPVVPGSELLPREFPVPRDPGLMVQDDDVEVALERRPEVLALQIERRRKELQLELARNTLLPQLDVGLLASQDVGDEVSDPDDKGPFELDAFLRFELPLQRRKAKGTTRANEAEITKLDRTLQFVRDRIATEVQDAASALQQSFRRVGQVRENVELAGRLEEAERLQLREGESDLFRVNLREQQTAAAASAMIDVLAEHFRSMADYRAVLGLPYDEVVAGRAVGGGPLR